MPTRRVVVLGLLALTASSLGCDPAQDRVKLLDDIGSQSASIVNGQVEFGDPAVGAISDGGSLCTATLVGKYTVITASHCVVPGRQHYFMVAGRYWTAKSAQRHPDYDPMAADNDVAVVTLTDAPPVQPASISSKPPQVGQTLTLVGYGATDTQGDGSGTKRRAMNKVAYITQTRIVISGSGGDIGNMCFGDSGGPTFAVIDGKEVQVGVHSTIAGNCGQQGHDMRVDVFADWVEQAAGGDVSIDGRPSPLFDTTPPAVTITSPANGGQVPFRFRLEAQVTDDSGVEKVELRVDGATLESRAQPPFDFDLQLDPGAHELTVAAIDVAGNTGQAAITVQVRAPVSFGDPCNTSNECLSNICGQSGDASYCTQLCDPAGEACPLGAPCLGAGGNANACGPPPVALDPATAGPGADQPGHGSGGCALGGQAPAPSLTLLLLALLVLRRRR